MGFFQKDWSNTTYFLNDFSLYLVIIIASVSAVIFLFWKTYKSAKSLTFKKITISLLSTFLILILVYSCAEAYFRYFYDKSDGLGFMKINQKWQERHVIFNSNFFRDKEFKIEKTPNVTRIGILGDSITFGQGIAHTKDRFSNILEKKLKDAGYNVEVYNLGRPGYDTQAEINVYHKIKYYNFDIIIWEYFLNDIQREDQSTGTIALNEGGKRTMLVKKLSNFSFFFDYLYWRITSRHNHTIIALRNADFSLYHNGSALAQHKKEISDFINELKTDNKKVVTIIFPSLFFLGSNYPAEDIHKTIDSIFRENGLETIDLLDYLQDKKPQEVMASRFDAHPNEYVHKLAAEKLFDIVQKLIN